MKQELPRVYGDTNGDLYNFFWSLTTLELNMWENNMQSIWPQYLKYHNITEDWEGKKYAGIDLKWDYDNRTCSATMDVYILDLRYKHQHMQP